MYISWQDFTPSEAIKSIKTSSTTNKKEYLKRWISLDTETSHNHDKENPIGWVYQWAFKLGESVVYGRKPSEMMAALRKIADYYQLDNKKRCIIFVHNLSYDLQYLKDFIIDAFGEYKVLAIAKHHVISFTTDCFEWRCSYKLSNKSLAKWSKDLGCNNRKLEGFVDYESIHYQTEELSPNDWAYMFGDVETLDECIERQLALYGDTIATIPLTSTGYIRRDCRNEFKKDNHNWKRFQRTRLYPTTYALLRAEFSGGITHGDRFRIGKTIRPKEGEKIAHRDFRSHYPSQQRTRGFPMGNFVLYDTDVSISRVNEILKEYCIICEVTITNCEIKEANITFPYLQVSKCIEGRQGKIRMVKDNGRVLQLAGTVKLSCNEHDLKWLLRLYDFEYFNIDTLYASKRGYMPEFMVNTIDKYFHGKTMYKKLAEAETNPEKKLDYELSLMKAKNGLNGIYGCSATDCIRTSYLLENEDRENPWKAEYPDDIGKALDKFYNSRNSFMRYQWGCWTTSGARDELFVFIYDVIGVERCLYCDTDSIFYISDEETEKRIEEYNEKLTAKSMKLGAYIDYEGKIVTYNYFAIEDDISAFRFLHSKCYAYEDMNGELHCTIAGVPARVIEGTDEDGKPIYYTREEELGSIEELKEGKQFVKCGGTSVSYCEHEIDSFVNETEETEYASSAILWKTTKTLSSEIEAHFEPLTYII